MKKNWCKVMMASAIAIAVISGTGCGNRSKVEQTQAQSMEAHPDLNEIAEAVKQAYGEEYIPDMQYTKQEIKDLFGIGENLYDEIIAEGPKININIDNFIAVKAKKDMGEEVEKILNEYREYLLNDSMQYPANMIKIQASEVLRFQDYVFFVMLGTPSMEAEEQGEEAALQSAEEKNMLAVNAIEQIFK